MSYVWKAEGSAFDYPTCYRTENRFLTLHAATVFVVAVVLMWLALAEPSSPGPGEVLRVAKARGAAEPHVMMSMLLLVIGAIDLVIAARQRRVRLLPGQPGGLAGEVPPHAVGVGAGAVGLAQVVKGGHIQTEPLSGRYRRALLALSPYWASAPVTLVGYLRIRIANVFFAGGLLLALGVVSLVGAGRPTVPVAALLFGVLAIAQMAYSAWIAGRAPSPVALMTVLLAAFTAGLAIVWLVGPIPHLGSLGPLALPQATAVLLGLILLIESSALLAGRAQLEPPPPPLEASESFAAVPADGARLLAAVDRQLLRHWTEGVPNRRYMRSLVAEATSGADPRQHLLEESNPTVPEPQRQSLPAQSLQRRVWLLCQATSGLLATILGGVMWLRMCSALMADAASSWSNAATAIVLVLAGAYAIRAAHFAWSRIDVLSTLYAVELTSGSPNASGQQGPRPNRTDPGLAASETAGLHVRVLRVESFFYAAAEHGPGSRRLKGWTNAGAVARELVADIVDAAQREATPPMAATRRQRPGPDSSESPPAATAGGRLMPRFCSACGAPILQGARFCQNCGFQLGPN